ncbi:MAG: hypothetical protein M1834_002951 [Cirrosporium novae-zelandiae]|nr:MAG: hypothetical protein M1834_002951 [Cirrosporium novae-zelandiae]
MAASHLDDLDHVFDDHPSLSELEDISHGDNQSPIFDMPSQHSGFQETDTDPEPDSDSGSVWSPPAWKGSGWYRHNPYAQTPLHLRSYKDPSKSRESSPAYIMKQEDNKSMFDVTLPASIPLPAGSDSPLKERSPEPEPLRQKAASASVLPVVKEESPTKDIGLKKPLDPEKHTNSENYIRIQVRAEVQHRTLPFENALDYFQSKLQQATKSWTSTIFSILILFLSISTIPKLFQPPRDLPPVPDLVLIAKMTEGFDDQVAASANGYHQAVELQDSSVAVWDLGESVRTSNMTSSVQIYESLDSLSGDLKALSNLLTEFLSSVNGDVDGILLVMDWAIRELSSIPAPTASPFSMIDNFHAHLSNSVLFENQNTRVPTPLGAAVNTLLGASSTQRTRQKVQVTFNELISVLEETINSEITHSNKLLVYFQDVENQFKNLGRIVARETDEQTRAESENLASLWTRVLGPNPSQLRKYERNRALLESVRARTIANAKLVLRHNGQLVQVQYQLENLRRQLVTPLLNRRTTTSASVGEQIIGLKERLGTLKGVRAGQKEKMLEMVYHAGEGKTRIVGGESAKPTVLEIEGEN